MKLIVKDFFKTKIPIKTNVNNMFGKFEKEELANETFPQLLERINLWIEDNHLKVVNVETLHRQDKDLQIVEYIRIWYEELKQKERYEEKLRYDKTEETLKPIKYHDEIRRYDKTQEVLKPIRYDKTQELLKPVRYEKPKAKEELKSIRTETLTKEEIMKFEKNKENFQEEYIKPKEEQLKYSYDIRNKPEEKIEEKPKLKEFDILDFLN